MEKRPKWNVESLNIAILGTDGKYFRKMAWIRTASGGIYCGTASIFAVGTKLSYHTNGDLYHGFEQPREKKIENLPKRTKLKYPLINEIKGLVPFYSTGIGWGDHLPSFPFEKIDEAVYVDVRSKGGVSFNLGFLEPHAFQSLNMRHYHNPHIHIIARTNPWIVIWTYDDRPSAQPIWMSQKKVIRCEKCKNPLNITRDPQNKSKMQHASCDICGFNITTQICSNCEKGLLVQLYEKMDPSSKIEPKRIVLRNECRGIDGFSGGCGWKQDLTNQMK